MYSLMLVGLNRVCSVEQTSETEGTMRERDGGREREREGERERERERERDGVGGGKNNQRRSSGLIHATMYLHKLRMLRMNVELLLPLELLAVHEYIPEFFTSTLRSSRMD